MAKTARQGLARLLAGAEPVGADSATVRLPGDALEHLHDELGLPADAHLRAELHSLLV